MLFLAQLISNPQNEREAQVPAHDQQNDLRFKLAPLENRRGQEKHLASLSRDNCKVATLDLDGSVADRCKIHATNRLRHRLNDWAGLTNGSWTMFGPISGSPSIDKALKIEPWARRAVFPTLYPLIVRSCVAGACTYLQQILLTVLVQILLSVCFYLARGFADFKRPGPRSKFPERWLLVRLVV